MPKSIKLATINSNFKHQAPASTLDMSSLNGSKIAKTDIYVYIKSLKINYVIKIGKKKVNRNK